MLLGDRLIHLEVECGNFDIEWWHMICEQTGQENQGDCSIDSDLKGDDMNVISIHSICCSKHHDKPSKLGLRALRCCRYMYNETNDILWTINTFSFSEGTAFRSFM